MTSPETNAPRIPRRILTAVMNSIAAGVTPRTGIEHLAVGRKEEIGAIVTDLDNVGDGAAAFRVVSGPFGSGKSFLLQLARNYALERNYVVMDADLSPERRFTGTQGQGLATYRELAKNMSTKTRPDGGAFATVLEKWISGVQADVMREQGLSAGDPTFAKAVEIKIVEAVNSMEGLVHGFDFAQVIATYWRGYVEQDETKKAAALRWLRGEYTTKTEARDALGGAVRVMIDDDAWYDYVKLLASFVTTIGYRGLIVVIDEAVNLYKISHTQARLSNYEKLLTILNDCLQGKAQHVGILVGATPQMVEDTRRGLFSYDALRTRLQESRFAARAGLRDVSGTVIKLEPLSFEEIFVLLQRLRYLHATFHGYPERVTDEQLKAFMEETLNRLGADRFTTPREVIRDFIAVLNLLQQNPDLDFDALVRGDSFQPTAPGPDLDAVKAEDAAEPARQVAADSIGNESIESRFKAFTL
ncbi:MAG TPA: ATP-binding protein [Candidatus Elarobacter sp.]|nr:ATP-binding protein [Candidatus Elarobacter sp.]